jgi:hypothetical protein
MKATLLAMLAMLLTAGCNDSTQPGRDSSPASRPDIASPPSGHPESAMKNQKRSPTAADINSMNKAVESFYVQEGRFPNDLLELVEKKYVRRMPPLPDTATWDYDTNSGVVSIRKN